MKRILIDVDTQFDFMDPEGALFVEADQSVRDAIKSTLMQASVEGIGDSYDAIIGSVDSHAYDAWEFAENGGPFPAHCVKGQAGWLRVNPDFPSKQRFIPMTETTHPEQVEAKVLVGEDVQGEGPRTLINAGFSLPAMDGVGLYFEKEVYSLFSNPVAELILADLVNRMGGKDNVVFDVIGYCAGGYCVDAVVEGLIERGYTVRVLSYATAAIGGADGMAKSKEVLTALGAEWVETP